MSNVHKAIQAVSDYRIREDDISLGCELLSQPTQAMERFSACESLVLATIEWDGSKRYCLVHRFESQWEGQESFVRATKLRVDAKSALADAASIEAHTSYGTL